MSQTTSRRQDLFESRELGQSLTRLWQHGIAPIPMRRVVAELAPDGEVAPPD